MVLSTLLAPLQFFSLFFNFLPGLYVYFVVPYLLWKIWFKPDDYKVNPTLYYRKTPIILVVIVGMFFAEILLYSLIKYPPLASKTAVITIYTVSLFKLCHDDFYLAAKHLKVRQKASLYQHYQFILSDVSMSFIFVHNCTDFEFAFIFYVRRLFESPSVRLEISERI